MRMAFGLVSVLVTLGIIMILIRDFELPEVEQAHLVQQQVQQFGGRDQNGTPIERTYTLYADNRSDGKMLDFQLTQINADSPLRTAFGLQVNDVILGTIDTHGVPTDFAGSDDQEACKLAVRDAVAFGGKIIVQRGGQKLVLPQGPAQRGAPQSGNPTAGQNQASQPPRQNGNSQDDAMKQIKDRLHALPTY
jgi:hypothetical protein